MEAASESEEDLRKMNSVDGSPLIILQKGQWGGGVVVRPNTFDTVKVTVINVIFLF